MTEPDRLVSRSYGIVPRATLRAISATCGPRGVQIWAALTTWATGGEGAVWPHQDAIADLCACDVRTVQRTLTELREGGWITQTALIVNGRKVGNIYHINETIDTTPVSPPKHKAEATPMSPPKATPMSLPSKRPKKRPLLPVASDEDDKTVKTPRRSQVPESFVLRALMSDEETTRWKETFGEGNAAREELDQFRDYHTSRGSLRVDWRATLRTWCRNAYGAKPKTKTGDATFADQQDFWRKEHLRAVRDGVIEDE